MEAAINLTPQQKEPFWQAYWEYRGQMAKIAERSAALIGQFVESWGVITDQQAERMANEMAEIDQMRCETRSKYFKRIQKILMAKQFVRFYQIENKMDAVIAFDLAALIPVAQ